MACFIIKFHAIRAYLIISLVLTLAHIVDSAEERGQEGLNQRHTYADVLFQASRLSQQQKYLETFDIQEQLNKVLHALYYPSHGNFAKEWEGAPSDLMANSGSNTDVDPGAMHWIMMSALQEVSMNNSTISLCVNDTGRLLTSLFSRESWATQFLDAVGKPGPGITLGRLTFVGDYKQCRAAVAPPLPDERRKGFSGNYCTVRLNLGPPSPLGQQPAAQIGICMPDSCSTDEVAEFVREAVEKLGLNGTVSGSVAECQTPDREMTTATVISIIVVVAIGGLMILGTAFDIIFIQRPKWAVKSAEEQGLVTNATIPEGHGYSPISPENGDVVMASETSALLGKSKETRPAGGALDRSTIAKILVAFSVYTNGSKVLNTHQPPGSLGAIHGIRFLSMSWVILGHTYAFGLSFTVNLASEYATLTKRWTFDAVSNALVSVDTFFTLSGLLTAYLTMKEMKRRGWNINWPLFYFHRFWRLTPPYMLCLLIVLGFQQYLGSGALWSNMQPTDKENCEKYWWANLLYINNLVDVKKMCFGHSWYLSNDMQFFILSPLMLVPFYFNKFLGLASCLVFLLTCWITTGILSTINLWPASLISTDAHVGSYFTDYYIVPWCRIGPYIVGVLAGFLLAVTNGGKQFKMKRYVAALGWIIATAVALATLYGLRGDISGEHRNTVGVAAFYNAVARSAWGASVCWVIIACASGYGGFVNTLLSWSPFVALGRLTYMAYLIHPCLLFVYFQNREQLYYLTDMNIAVTYCGALVLVNMVAFVLTLGFESPMIGLEKTFLRKQRND